MAEEEKNNETKEEKTGETKDETVFSKFIKKTKKTVNDTILEAKIRAAFENEHEIFTVYTQKGLLPRALNGSIVDGVLTVFDKVNVKNWSVVTENKTEKAYYVISSTAAIVTVDVDGITYERPGTALYLDENVEEVNVVKAGKHYYLYKGPNKS